MNDVYNTVIWLTILNIHSNEWTENVEAKKFTLILVVEKIISVKIFCVTFSIVWFVMLT